jgi:cell division septum initiation protein DivIVA
MPDCSDLKDKYDKAKDKADRMRDKADAARDRYEDAEDDFEFESGRDCELHIITLPDGTPIPDTQAQEDCLRERQRAADRYRDKMYREESRMKDAEYDAENAEGESSDARIEWCACEEQNREGEGEPEPEFDFEDFPASEPGDWNEPDWNGYVIA